MNDGQTFPSGLTVWPGNTWVTRFMGALFKRAPRYAEGTATFSGTSATAVVQHDLGIAPQLCNITVTPGTAAATGQYIWVSGITATQFTLNRTLTAPAGMTVGWVACLRGYN